MEIRQASFPFLGLKQQFAEIRQEVWVAIERVMESQQFIGRSAARVVEAVAGSYSE